MQPTIQVLSEEPTHAILALGGVQLRQVPDVARVASVDIFAGAEEDRVPVVKLCVESIENLH
jgi:hypothetical protein